MNRKSFVCYEQWLDMMCTVKAEDAQEILKAIRAEINDEPYEFTNESMGAVYETIIAADLKENKRKYNEKAEAVRNARAEAGRKGATSRWQNMANYGKTMAKHSKPMANDGNAWQTMANDGNVNVNVNVNDIDISNDISIKDLPFESDRLKEAMGKWVTARKAIGQYPPQAISQTISLATRYEKQFGVEKCIEAIEKAIAGGYKAIIWPRDIPKKTGFTSFEQNQYDFDELEKQLLERQT